MTRLNDGLKHFICETDYLSTTEEYTFEPTEEYSRNTSNKVAETLCKFAFM